MRDTHASDVYDTLCGTLVPDARVPGIEDAFAPGSPCAGRYADAMEAYDRLRRRLGVTDEDRDVECIINALLDNTRELCLLMYSYGFSRK